MHNPAAPEFWPDGTVKSKGNAFTHVYRKDSPIVEAPVRSGNPKGGFGAKGGTIPGMGLPPIPAHHARPSSMTIKKARG